MKQEDLFKKLGLILKELNEQYQFLAQNPQQMSELELELFQANANFLAEHVQIIKKINNNQQSSFAITPTDEVVNELTNSFDLAEDTHEESQLEEITFADVQEEKIETVEEFAKVEQQEREIVKEKPESIIHFEEIEEEVFKVDHEPSTFEFILNDHSEHEKFEFEEKNVEELFNRPLSEEEQILIAKKKLSEQLPETEAVEADEDEIGPEPFLVQKEVALPITKKEDLELAPVETVMVNTSEPVEDPTYKPTLNDLLAKSNGVNLNSTTQKSVKDLKQAINLNDKLLFIKDLFNGYNLAYSEAIDIANKLPNFEAADNFFQKNYATKNNWAAKQATVDKFYQLLNQRFK